MKNKKITPLPIHFKKPGRSYSQIGRKGNVALYAVYSDYFLLKDFYLPYLLIGFELVCIKIKGLKEQYPRASEFGRSAWSIPKSFKRIRRTCSRLGQSMQQGSRCSTLKTFLDWSASSRASATMATC